MYLKTGLVSVDLPSCEKALNCRVFSLQGEFGRVCHGQLCWRFIARITWQIAIIDNIVL